MATHQVQLSYDTGRKVVSIFATVETFPGSDCPIVRPGINPECGLDRFAQAELIENAIADGRIKLEVR